MATFDLPEEAVRRILRWVHYMQMSMLFIVGLLLALSPRDRFGRPYDVLFAFPPGRYVLAAIFIACSLLMWWALHVDNRKVMGFALRVAGLNALALALLLILGSIAGPVGVTGGVFAAYMGMHLVLQSVLMNARE